MASDKKLSDDLNASDADRVNGFESLQSQLDAFLEKEKEAIAGTEQNTYELQHRLDHFINNLQYDLDRFIEENPTSGMVASRVSDGVGVPEPVLLVGQAQASEQVKKPPLQSQKKQPSMVESANSVPYSKLIARVLVGASCVTAIILWFVWPVEPGLSPQVVEHKQPSEVISTTTADEPAPVNETVEPDTKILSPVASAAPKQAKVTVQLVPAKPGKATIQTDAPAAETDVAQAMPAVDIILTVVASIGNIRNAPDRSGKVLYRLVQGAEVTKLAEQKGWYQVRLRNGTVAWAHHSIF